MMGRLRAVLVALVVVAVVLAPSPAQAHVALEGSTPATGERLAYPPEEVVLTFTAPVDPATLTVTLRDADGADVAVSPRATGPEPVSVAAFDLPRLEHGVYGMTWESVGDDGHRTRGEVLFGVGVAPTGAQVASGPRDPVATALDGVAGLVRVLWYLGLAAAAAVAVLRRARGAPLAAAVLARRQLVLRGLAGAALLRAAIGFTIILQAGGGVSRALLGRSTLSWAGLAVGVLLVSMVTSRPVSTPRLRRVASGPGLAWGVFASAVLVGTFAGHAPGRPDPVLAVTFGAAHVGAAAVWVGPLLAILVATRAPGWTVLTSAERRAALQQALRAVVPAAGGALAVVLLSGAMLALRTWDGAGLPSGTWAVVLGLKTVVVIAVILPLGWVHHRRSASWSALPRTWRVETAGLLTVVVLGSVLVGVDPGWGGPEAAADDALVALLDGQADDPAACADLDVGRAACYRTSLASMMVEQGPQAAIDTIAELMAVDDYVSTNCHQVAHDLGNDASERIADMAEALAVEGSVCWSGYYHGFVEARLAAIEDAELMADLPTFCDGAADPRYSFTHYNCLHGLGHGLMLRFDTELFDALPLCEGLEEDWTIRSCASGAFMENVMTAQQGEEGDFDDTDLLYPCNAIEGLITEDCYLMQTSHILWRIGGDLATAFEWCDAAPPEYTATCYRSMGRDISGRSLLDVEQVVAGCHLGRPDMIPWCFDGAAANAVYDTAATDRADALCAAVGGESRQRCIAARDQAAATVAAG